MAPVGLCVCVANNILLKGYVVVYIINLLVKHFELQEFVTEFASVKIFRAVRCGLIRSILFFFNRVRRQVSF